MVAASVLGLVVLSAVRFSGYEIEFRWFRDISVLVAISMLSSAPLLFLKVRWYWILVLSSILALFGVVVAAFVIFKFLGG